MTPPNESSRREEHSPTVTRKGEGFSSMDTWTVRPLLLGTRPFIGDIIGKMGFIKLFHVLVGCPLTPRLIGFHCLLPKGASPHSLFHLMEGIHGRLCPCHSPTSGDSVEAFHGDGIDTIDTMADTGG
jgi:hypothetical protein